MTPKWPQTPPDYIPKAQASHVLAFFLPENQVIAFSTASSIAIDITLNRLKMKLRGLLA
ncbi:hypothetical protein [Pseudomonas sp. 6D_7.1_Bac1]|uniref:hypothetical protein n=1 Tax=Pseudomonas sp. 6D_7.1_Bac1 TaxID=2971615 RepID=UPI0021C59DBB|nr:hypothetical protein [Pseudomonas sp. 6D_7.1_Bac1]MCU1750090.1 hypothetical protein [Pseudomonas sp. 6D_7.1_Bac1]